MKKSPMVQDILLSAACLAVLGTVFQDTNAAQSQKFFTACKDLAEKSQNKILIKYVNEKLGLGSIESMSARDQVKELITI